MTGLYAFFLLCSIAGLGILDYRFKLAVFNKPKQAFGILVFAIGIFILWDAAGILMNIFRIGDNSLLIGLRIGEFPAEEVVFLALLNYTSLVAYCLFRRNI